MLGCLRSAAQAQRPETVAAQRLDALRRHHSSAVEDASAASDDPSAAASVVRVCTFNLLAPCYKRLTASKYKREAQDAELWHERVDASLQFMQQSLLPHVDILGLQEYWFDQDFETRLARAIGPEFEIKTHRRIGDKADGVALVLRKSRFEIVAEKGYPLTKIGSRVGLSVLLQDCSSKQRLLMTVTHLSFPHCDFSRDAQLSQSRNLLREVSEFAHRQGLGADTPRIVVGDFNAELSEPACQLFLECGYVDAFSVLAATRGQDAAVPGAPLFVSHRNHRQEAVGVDHIFFRCDPHPAAASSRPDSEEQKCSDGQNDNQELLQQQRTGTHRMLVSEWYMLPAELDIQQWHDEFTLSDHRPVGTVFQITPAKPTTSD